MSESDLGAREDREPRIGPTHRFSDKGDTTMQLVCGRTYRLHIANGRKHTAHGRESRSTIIVTMTYCGGSQVDHEGHYIAGGCWAKGHHPDVKYFYDLNVQGITTIDDEGHGWRIFKALYDGHWMVTYDPMLLGKHSQVTALLKAAEANEQEATQATCPHVQIRLLRIARDQRAKAKKRVPARYIASDGTLRPTRLRLRSERPTMEE